MTFRIAATAVILAAAALAHMSGPTKLQLFRSDRIGHGSSAGYTISVTPFSGLKDGDFVTISYSSSTPSLTDLVIAYSPLPVNFSMNAPIEWFLASQDPKYMATGTGSLQARLINMRDTYAFVIATGSALSPVVRAASANVTFANANEPRAARLSLTASPTEMRVSWSSKLIANPVLTLTGSAAIPAQSLSYNQSDMCGAPATTTGYRNPGYIHTAILTGLVPGTTYGYSVGDDTGSLGPYFFRQPPMGNASDAFPFVFTAVGDMGQLNTDGSDEVSPFPPAPNTTRLVARDITTYGSNMHMHIGDLSYARGYASEWDFFWANVASGDSLISPLVPYHVNLGNHERDFPGSAPSGGPSWLFGSDSGGECGVPAATQFLMPTPDGVLASRTTLWWSSAVGPVFTVHFSSELDSSVGGPLWTFVKQALASVDRSVTPWVVVATHRPMYISSTNVAPDGGDQTVATILRDTIEPLLMDAGGSPVDLFLQGHHHSYQRGSAVFNMTVLAHSTGPLNTYKGGLAPLQMVIGTGGAGFSTNIQTPQPDWAEVVQFWHGYARITVHNASALQWQFVNDIDGNVADEAWIVK